MLTAWLVLWYCSGVVGVLFWWTVLEREPLIGNLMPALAAFGLGGPVTCAYLAYSEWQARKMERELGE